MGSKFRHSLVDLITDSGSTWVKISTITNKRLLYDLAKEALFCGDSEDDDEGPGYTIDDDLDIPLIKQIKELGYAARNYRIRTVQPVVHLVLPRIKEMDNVEVGKVINLCRQIPGVQVLCHDNLSPTPELDSETMSRMYWDPRTSFSNTLNVDTSIVVALTSDFSHTSVVPQDWFDRQRVAHAEQETKENFLLRQVYPVIEGHELVCVEEAVETWKHIVNTIGTPGERARAKLILGEDSSMSSEQLIAELQEWSIHPVPRALRLPVRVVKLADSQERLPPVAQSVLESQLNPGRSVFSYGWANKLTTVTCNGVATKQLAHGLEDSLERNGRSLDADVWPSMWAFSSSRPLLGVPKAAGWPKKHIGDCETNGCTCGVDKFHA